jgi:hypothetical protein
MKHILCSLPLVFLITATSVHEAQKLHHHLSDPNWMPLASGLCAIGFATIIAWSRT